VLRIRVLDYCVYCNNYPVMALTIPPYDFEPVYSNSE